MGATSASMIDLHGLNSNSTDLPTDLQQFAPSVWGDQGNSPNKYAQSGVGRDSLDWSALCPDVRISSLEAPPRIQESGEQ
jgi:hypothetical protein